jgi:hypothetical protein
VPRRPPADDGFDTEYRVPREGDADGSASAGADVGDGSYGSRRARQRASSNGGDDGGELPRERGELRGSGGGLRVAWEGEEEEDPPPATAAEPVERDRFGRPLARPAAAGAAGRGKDRPIGSSIDIGSSLDSKFGSGEYGAGRRDKAGKWDDSGNWEDTGSWDNSGNYTWDEDTGDRGTCLDDDLSANVANYVADES